MFFSLQHFKNSLTYLIISSMPGFCILTILVAFTTTTGKLEGGVNVFVHVTLQVKMAMRDLQGFF